MGLTYYALEQMGFRRKTDEEVLSATFSCVYAFEIRGLSSYQGMLIDDAGSVGGIDYRLALSESLNVATQRVASDDFADDEPAWVAEHKCSPPYLLVHIGPTSLHAMTGHFLKDEAPVIQTYDAFISARQELREMEAKVIPSLLSALSCTFSTLPHPVKFRQLERAVAGKTTDGRTIFDFGFEFLAESHLNQTVPSPNLRELVSRSIELASRMSSKVSRFYHLALQEDDPLKRFLYPFLTIERQTHAAFKSIDHGQQMAIMLRAPTRVQTSGTVFLQS